MIFQHLTSFLFIFIHLCISEVYSHIIQLKIIQHCFRPWISKIQGYWNSLWNRLYHDLYSLCNAVTLITMMWKQLELVWIWKTFKRLEVSISLSLYAKVVFSTLALMEEVTNIFYPQLMVPGKLRQLWRQGLAVGWGMAAPFWLPDTLNTALQRGVCCSVTNDERLPYCHTICNRNVIYKMVLWYTYNSSLEQFHWCCPFATEKEVLN